MCTNMKKNYIRGLLKFQGVRESNDLSYRRIQQGLF